MLRHLCMLLLTLSLPAWAQNAGLDPRFGDHGRVSVRDPNSSNARNLGLAACAGPGGRLNVVTATVVDSLSVFRFMPDGTLDTSFSSDGIARIPVPPSADDTAHGACMADGRIVVVRMAPGTGGDQNIQIFRVLPEGTLDPTFGIGGVVVLDFDAHATGLGNLEFPLGLNLIAGNQMLVSVRLYLSTGASVPAIARIAEGGTVLIARIVDVPGMTAVYASAAGLAADGRIWLVGGGNPNGRPFNTWFRVELAASDGATLATHLGADGNYIVDGGRILANGTMVAVGKYVPQSEPGGPYRPRLLVFRAGGTTHVTLPALTAVGATVPTLAPFPGHGVAIPTADGRVLFTAPMGGQDGEYERATYVAQVELGATAAEDRVDTRFGNGGAIQFAYRLAAPCSAGSPPLQRMVRATNWLGQPTLVGTHSTTCTDNPRNLAVARLLTRSHVFIDGMGD